MNNGTICGFVCIEIVFGLVVCVMDAFTEICVKGMVILKVFLFT